MGSLLWCRAWCSGILCLMQFVAEILTVVRDENWNTCLIFEQESDSPSEREGSRSSRKHSRSTRDRKSRSRSVSPNTPRRSSKKKKKKSRKWNWNNLVCEYDMISDNLKFNTKWEPEGMIGRSATERFPLSWCRFLSKSRVFIMITPFFHDLFCFLCFLDW